MVKNGTTEPLHPTISAMYDHAKAAPTNCNNEKVVRPMAPIGGKDIREQPSISEAIGGPGRSAQRSPSIAIADREIFIQDKRNCRMIDFKTSETDYTDHCTDGRSANDAVPPSCSCGSVLS